MTKLKDVLQIYVAPSVLGVITVYSDRRQVFTQYKNLGQLQHKNNEEIRKMQEEFWGDKLVNNEFKLESCSSRIT